MTVFTKLPREKTPAGHPVTLGTYVRTYLAKVRGGDMGALPAILGLIALTVTFSAARPVFFSPANLANLLSQGAAVTVIAMGLVFVLLLGEIDLSARLRQRRLRRGPGHAADHARLPWYVAVLGAIVTGVVIGVVIGLLVTKIGIPSFVVTLAAFLAFQGAVLLLIRGGTIISVDDPTIKKINFDGRFTPLQGWILYGVTIAAIAGLQLWKRTSRSRRGLAVEPLSVVWLRVGSLAVLMGLGVYVLNLERGRNILFSQRGVPMVVLLIGGLLVLWTFVLGRTAYGRHLYAVGGNKEAARRAGINIDAIRISVFVVCSAMAAVGGIIAASRQASVDPNTGGSNVLLYAVGAAVIGGTSLFGGKGRVLDAVLGGAVVAVIENGMGLMQYTAGQKFIVTGVVLLAAAGIDALSRRRAASAGLR